MKEETTLDELVRFMSSDDTFIALYLCPETVSLAIDDEPSHEQLSPAGYKLLKFGTAEWHINQPHNNSKLINPTKWQWLLFNIRRYGSSLGWTVDVVGVALQSSGYTTL